jgi:hypothetical protein
MMDEGGRCPRCGAAVEPLQEYCLECGHRLRTTGIVPALASAWRTRLRWYPGDWVWPSLLALVVAVLSAAGAILWTRDAESAASETVVGDTSPLPTTATTATTATPGPTVPTSTRPARPRPRPRRRARLIEWPRRANAWTLVLSSVQTSGGRAPAVAKARRALRAGLPQVGVLDSSRYPSLHPGYFVVFSGVYPSLSEAQRAIARASAAGYGNAYARRVTT